MKITRNLLFTLLIMGVLSGCYTESKNPLSPSEGAIADLRLIGKWKTKDGDLLIITATHKGAWMHLEEVPSKKGGTTPAFYDFYPTAIGSQRFLNIRMTEYDAKNRPKKRRGYIFAHYEVSKKGTLSFCTMSDEEMAKVVKTGKLKGHVEKGQYLTDVFINDSTENLVTFLKTTNLKTIFPNCVTFKKVL
ncbi:MAG: hypothetical protein ABIP97_04575 [Chthoniobacterales bacterium]